MCTDETEVSEYWHNINASLDLDIRVLDDVEAEATEVKENNSWLTYGEPLHRAREFGVMVPAIDALNERLLSRLEIKNVCEILLGSSNGPLPNPDANWVAFVQAVRAAQEGSPPTFCPVKKMLAPWIDVEALLRYTPDPIRAGMNLSHTRSDTHTLSHTLSRRNPFEQWSSRTKTCCGSFISSTPSTQLISKTLLSAKPPPPNQRN